MATPLPPTTIHTTTSIPSSSAHDFLSAYLDRATTDPALQPDASITEHGPTSRTTASAPNLALHNLKRVQAGLGGEVLGRDLLLGEDGTLREDGPAENGAAGGTGDNHKDGGDEWEEAKQYEQEQGQDGDGNEQADSGAVDKEERKRKKKERRLAEKRSKSGGGEA